MTVSGFKEQVFRWTNNITGYYWNAPNDEFNVRHVYKLYELTGGHTNVHIIKRPSTFIIYDFAQDKPINRKSELNIYKDNANSYFLMADNCIVKSQRFDSIADIKNMFNNNNDTLFFVYEIKKEKKGSTFFLRYSKLKKPQIKRYKL